MQKYQSFILFHELLNGHYGAILKHLNAEIGGEQAMNTSLYTERLRLLQFLQYHHIVALENNWNIVRFPKDFTLF